MAIANPFGAFFHLARFYGQGGVIVDDRPYLWTLVQPDGDVVSRISRGFIALEESRRDSVLDRHLAKIGAIRSATLSLRGTLRFLRANAWWPSALTVVGGSTVLSWEWLFALLASSGGLGVGARFARPMAVRGGVAFVRWTFRRTVRGRLGRPGRD